MKRWIPILLLICAAAALPSTAGAQRTYRRRDVKGWWHQEWGRDEKGDSIAVIHMLPIPVYSRGVDLRRWNRLVAAVKRVYPVAKLAREKMADMEDELSRLKSRKEQKAYIKRVYDEIREEYTPILKRMTRTQGRVLIKLIDRETEYTAYDPKGVSGRLRRRILAGRVARLRPQPQERIRQGGRGPDDRADRGLLRGRAVVGQQFRPKIVNCEFVSYICRQNRNLICLRI